MSSSGAQNPSKATTNSTLSSSILTKPTRKNTACSDLSTDVIGKVTLSSGKVATSSADKGKGIVTDNIGKPMPFKDVGLGPHEGEVRFRLIHFWEALNTQTKVLIGLEMLLIDDEETVIQGFIPQGRVETYLPRLRAGATYRLNKFYGSKNKNLYRVAEPIATITLSWNYVLSVLEDTSVCFPEDRFRFHGYKEFEAACDLRGDLYGKNLISSPTVVYVDFIGHIRLVNGQVLNASLVLDEAEIASTSRVLLHVQTHDDPIIKLYLWDKAASDFIVKFKASASNARVILVTALNPKRFGGTLSLCTMTPSRVFMDSDVEETRYYLSWLNSNEDVANRVEAQVVTKTETATLEGLFSYMMLADAKVAWFECIATIDDVVNGSGWYYIGCGVCHTKATKGATTLMCKKCGKSEIVGVPQYLSKISVYDHSEQAVFVLLGDAGQELTGKKASELVESYYEANENAGADDLVPVPQALVDTIGQTRKFIVKVSTNNLTGKTQVLTVTKVLPLEVAELEGGLGENVDNVGDDGMEDTAAETVKRSSDGIELVGLKRAKCG